VEAARYYKEISDIRYDPYYRRAFLALHFSHWIALSEPAWRIAKGDEFDALQRNQNSRLVPCPPGINIVGSMWIFNTKF
jgi:hypothetical protein